MMFSKKNEQNMNDKSMCAVTGPLFFFGFKICLCKTYNLLTTHSFSSLT